MADKKLSEKASKVIKDNTGIIAEFKKFIARGNVLDMAVGIIIGSAFTAIVTSLVSDIITPLIGTIIAGINFDRLVLTIPWGGRPQIHIGSFIDAVINFFLTALCVFILIRTINKFTKKKEETKEPPKPSDEVVLLTEIRDLLKEQKEDKE
ncbi:MAG: large-conductance mechanosensitive channel protein MscL [Oscillospiraceae bacterium]|nr:large-conductance mechanosensitive channel protein MscL [Oscillospiraceae bacterium]